jgi:shikimate dehydrogenase
VDLEVLGVGPDALPQLLSAAELMGFAGLNITHPLKQAVIPLLTELSDDARALGAVNTVLLRDGRRIGHNTDWSGFAASFRRGLPGVPMDRVVLLGAGGAGAAVAHALLTLGTGVLSIFDVDAVRAERLAGELCGRFGAGKAVCVRDLEDAMARTRGLVHATPTGMASHPGLPLAERWLRSELWVAEIVYFPLETALLQSARGLGCRTLDGGGMAVFQAAEAFRLFTGTAPDPQRMLDHFAAMSAAVTKPPLPR